MPCLLNPGLKSWTECTSVAVSSGQWQQTSRTADGLYPTQAPKGRVSGLPTTSGSKPFQLWAQGLFCTERNLARRLKNNSFYPFTQQQPNVFVLEYYLDTLWKGTLLFIVCVFLVSFGLVSEVQRQETWGFPACGVAAGLWLMISSLPRRRLVLNHVRGVYHFSIQGRTVCQGPVHLVYVRMALSSDAYGRCFFQLVLCGHKLEPLVLVQLSERYEQMEYLGRHIARKLNINYFDCRATSYRHVVRHWPPGAAFSPGILLHKTACSPFPLLPPRALADASIAHRPHPPPTPALAEASPHRCIRPELLVASISPDLILCLNDALDPVTSSSTLNECEREGGLNDPLGSARPIGHMCRCSDARSLKSVGSLGDGEIDRQAGSGTASQEWKNREAG
ncbi:PREDICTED: transmembrane protein 249 [Lipotes vexillifer]|uniref:Transmembrane protein 249 n=1 Tax=Lipotes vexillifer TaxID=118797 RepID=A0A340XZE7_LIPVE|nr:PREDICTED: transmembrane protein 249 [Lipotes vexillifer]